MRRRSSRGRCWWSTAASWPAASTSSGGRMGAETRNTPKFPPGQTLLIDADDTLWENNIYFERAIASFISYLDHREYGPGEVRLKLNEVERESILEKGYGLTSFTHSLVTCFERLSFGPITTAKRERIASFARS